ncbi:hypothetical protein DCAR_0100086 [Daucus carota subsp. sativus]|uniref:Uncharacterized protein n=1 Tax=Daucus carota subsp. sativus TaxID=79200 RepID=A0AAF1AHP8_DAUCS|nr:hypothetical protein DCAR_0100072 [Daucus carota subsp. sativus]WOG80941.1 hypothetical protein DCAR_0100086 [Daucus carota subsp. sativus]
MKSGMEGGHYEEVPGVTKEASSSYWSWVENENELYEIESLSLTTKFGMDWCGSSTPRTPEYRTMNEERHERKAYWLVIVRPQFLIGGDTKGLWQSSWFFHVVKELNNENRRLVPDPN